MQDAGLAGRGRARGRTGSTGILEGTSAFLGKVGECLTAAIPYLLNLADMRFISIASIDLRTFR